MSPDPTEVTVAELRRALRSDPGLGENVWHAFGFGRDGAREHTFTDDDIDALTAFAGSDNTLPAAEQRAAAREIGMTMARLADWESDLVNRLVAAEGNTRSQAQIIDAISHVHALVWRQLIESRLRSDAGAEHDELVIGFADIVGYTSMSRRMTMAEIGTMLEAFESAAHRLVTDAGGRIVKTLGDGVMYATASPAAAATIAIGLHEQARDGEFPALRVGMALGDVLTRLGDTFGEPVNKAARLASSARSGTTLIDDQLADQLDGDARFHLRPIGSLSVRGYRRLRAHVLERHRHAPA